MRREEVKDLQEQLTSDNDTTGLVPKLADPLLVNVMMSFKTLEAGFGLPCLNHACDATSKVMTDLFGGD